MEEDKRLAQISDQIIRLANADFETFGVLSEKGDELDSIVVGLNLLSEELESQALHLNAYTTALEQRNNETTQFAYIAAHDLQEPLRTITNYIGLFQDDYRGKLDESADMYLDRKS